MRLLAVIGALALLVAVGLAGYFFGGFFSVAALSPESAFVSSIVERTRVASVSRHATDKPPANIGDPATVQAGARSFKSLGCYLCHGAPGLDWGKFSEGMKPDPPDLKDVVDKLTVSEIFWIVRNGINMTGMPSFAKVGASDDEIWKVAAFAKKIPSVTDQDFKSWTEQPGAPAP